MVPNRLLFGDSFVQPGQLAGFSGSNQPSSKEIGKVDGIFAKSALFLSQHRGSLRRKPSSIIRAIHRTLLLSSPSRSQSVLSLPLRGLPKGLADKANPLEVRLWAERA
jgi:hypothetical protein